MQKDTERLIQRDITKSYNLSTYSEYVNMNY